MSTIPDLTVPLKQKAAVFTEVGGPITVQEVDVPEVGPTDVLVRLAYSGVCHTDLHIWLNDLPWPTQVPLIGGHEGAGHIVKVGSNVTHLKPGDRCGIKWVNGVCLNCEFCKRGFESNCPSQLITGYQRSGTFQQYALVRATDAVLIPEGVDLAEAAPILCAGLTAYKAIKETGAKPGQTLAITGAGGGLGSLAIQFGKAMGLRILAIDASNKEQHCRGLGADLFIDPFKTNDIVKDIQQLTNGGPHGVVCLAAVPRTMEQATEYVRTRGTVVLVGLPKDGKITTDIFFTIFRCVTIKGTNTCTRLDADEAFEFVQRGLVRCPVEIKPLTAIPETFERMQKAQISGRVVVDLWQTE